MISYSISSAAWSASGHDPAIAKQVLLGKDMLPGLTQFAHTVLQPSQSVETHTHADMWEIFHILSGTIILKVDGVSREISSGEGVLVKPNCNHTLLNNSAVAAYFLVFGFASSAYQNYLI